MTAQDGGPSIGAVVLTMNNRRAEFGRAVASLLAQRGVRLEVVVVGNGCEPEGVPAGAATLTLRENVGAPAGRNAGAEFLRPRAVDYLFFLDDDAVLPAPDTLARLAAEFRREGVAYVLPRILDPQTQQTLRRWIPRAGAKGADCPGPATGMAEGVLLVRRADFERAGGWPGHYFLYHEGIDLAWRLWDQGGTGWYAPEVHVHHPATDPSRHPEYYRLAARNRVWVAYRNLPAPLVPVYVLAWTVLTVARLRSGPPLRSSLAGMREGLAAVRGQQRRPMSWRTVRRLTEAGRPPIV